MLNSYAVILAWKPQLSIPSSSSISVANIWPH